MIESNPMAAYGPLRGVVKGRPPTRTGKLTHANSCLLSTHGHAFHALFGRPFSPWFRHTSTQISTT